VDGRAMTRPRGQSGSKPVEIVSIPDPADNSLAPEGIQA